jgi:ubiquinone/menaquinone biosynthesis C-methylase UbiE
MPASDRPPSTEALDQVRRTYACYAPKYDRWLAFCERALLRGGRAWVAARAVGRTLEIGVGTGRNLGYFPPGLQLVGVDASAPMLERARRRATGLGRPIDLLLADAQRLPFPDRSFDSVVSTLSLCTIPDEGRALAEARRVLRPGGRLIWLEHVRSAHPLVRSLQRLVEPLALRLGSDHLLRDPASWLAPLGFAIEEHQRLAAGMVERLLARAGEVVATASVNPRRS